MTYVSMYRRWRPQTFAEVVGQEHVTRTLRNAVAAGRVSHAYLFCGPRGTGKTSVAKLLAKALNCQNGPTPDPCGRCDACARIKEGRSMDVVEIDAASNRGIDEIRDLREKVKFAPVEERYKVYIIDEVHMLTQEAFNALLKTLEEPPSRVVFVLATTEPHKVLPTILSRCQRFDFRRLTNRELASRVSAVAASEGIQISEDAVRLIASSAQGAARDALGLLEQCVAYTGGAVTYDDAVAAIGVAGFRKVADFCDAIIRHDLAAALTLVRDIVESGHDPAQFVRDIIEHFRNLLVLRTCGPKTELVDAPEGVAEALKSQAARLSLEDIFRALDVLGAAEGDMRYSAAPLLTLEVATIKLARPGEAPVPSQSTSSQSIQVAPESRTGPDSKSRSVLAPGPVSAPPPEPTRAAEPAHGRATGEKQPSTAQTSVTLEQVRARWNDVLGALNGKGPVLAFYDKTIPASLAGNELAVACQTELHRDQASCPRYRTVVQQALKAVLGVDLVVKCVVAPRTSEKGAPVGPSVPFEEVPWPDAEEPAPADSEESAETDELEAAGEPEATDEPSKPAGPAGPSRSAGPVGPVERIKRVERAQRAERPGPGEAVSGAGTQSVEKAGEAPARHWGSGATPTREATSTPTIEVSASETRPDGREKGTGNADGSGNGNGNGEGTDTSEGDEGQFAESLARAKAAIMDHPAVKAAVSVFGGKVFKIDV